MGASSLEDIAGRLAAKAKARGEIQQQHRSDSAIEHCPTHGQWRANVADERGVRWLPDCPRCAGDRKARGLSERAAIPKRFAGCRLETYHATQPGQQRALRVAQDYAAGLREALDTGRSLLLCGRPGTGKTHLACGIAHEAMSLGITARFVTVLDFIRSVRASWRKDSTRTEEQVLADFAGVHLLVLDEVGVQYGTEAEGIHLFDLLNRRYQDCHPTVLISNLPATAEAGKPSVQGYLGERVFDRLREGGGRVVTFDWGSYRGRC